jgi:hypothetical protein
MSGVPADRFAPALVTLGGVQDHNLLHFSFVDAPAAAVLDIVVKGAESNRRKKGGGGEGNNDGVGGVSGGVKVVTGPVLLLYRFKPDNIMHTIHDDVLPAIQTALEGLGVGTVRVFRQGFTLEDAIGSHTCSLEALACV